MDPFALSKPYATDPVYSAEACLPERTGLALWSEKKSGPFWLYVPGSLEAWLLGRTRSEAFSTCLNVYYPGNCRTYRPILYGRREFPLEAVPAALPCSLYFNGSISLNINGRVVVHATGATSPTRVSVDIAPYLKPGQNHVKVRVSSEGSPPVVLLESACVQTDSDWEVGENDQQWHVPRCLPFEGDARYPHAEDLPEVPVELRQDESGIYDAGIQLIARPVIRARGVGAVAIHPGESCPEAVDPSETVKEQIIPVVAVAGEGEYQSETKLAFRYLRLVCDQAVTVEGVRAAASIHPVQYRGAFACSDSRLTDIWMHAAYTLRACMRLTFVDGLKRDRLPWVGDLYVCNLGNYHSFFARPVSEYSLAALMGDDPGEADLNGTITYSLFWILAARDHALYLGDSSFLRGVLAYSRKVMAAARAKADARGLLPTDRFAWLYIDWAEVHTRGYSSFLNCLYVMALDAAAELHRMVGDESASSAFARQAADLRRLCRELFWDPERKFFVDQVEQGRPGVRFGRQSNALAVLSGVCSAEQRPDLLRHVFMNKGVPPVGTPYMMFFEARALAACGEPAAMLAMIRDYWGSMLDAGASTFWEAHDVSLEGDKRYAFYGRPYAKSLCHAWSSGPLQLLSAELFGLKPLQQGWQEFAVNPVLRGLEWACSETPTPHGPIKVQVLGGRAAVSFPKGTRLVWGAGENAQRHDGPADLEFELGSGNGNDGSIWRSPS